MKFVVLCGTQEKELYSSMHAGEKVRLHKAPQSEFILQIEGLH
jgi:hypothetical protein